MTDKIKESFENVNINLENDLKMQKLREELAKRFKDYKTTMSFMATDAPIAVLCLNPSLETILINEGYLRVYDLLNMDFTKIKGIGIVRSRELAASLEQFFSVL